MRIISSLIIVIFICTSACQQNNQNTRDNNKFKVGVILPLTGSLAEYGIAVKNALELAKTNHPEKMNQVKFIYEDSEYLGAKSVAAFQKLVKSDKVNLIYNWGTAPNEAVIPLAEKQEIPNIVTTVDLGIVANKNYSIRSMPSSRDFANILNKYFEDNKILKIGILKNELTYFNSILAELDSTKIQHVESIPLDTNDFKSIISKIQNKEIDSLGIFLISGQIAQFYNQAKNQNFQIKTFGTDFFDSQNEVNQSSDLINNAIFASIAVSADFRKLYQQAYGNDLQIGFAGVAFDHALLIGELFNAQPHLSSLEIINKLKNIRPFLGVTGETYFNETEENGMEIRSPAQLKIIKNKEIKNYQITKNDGV